MITVKIRETFPKDPAERKVFKYGENVLTRWFHEPFFLVCHSCETCPRPDRGTGIHGPLCHSCETCPRPDQGAEIYGPLVIPAEAGIHIIGIDSRLHGNDTIPTCYSCKREKILFRPNLGLLKIPN